MKLIRSLVLSGIVGLLLSHASPADEFAVPQNTEKSTSSPLSPAEVIKTVKLPPGFQLSVVAAEPQIQNPIAMTIDERGRLWIAENYSWSGGGAGGFDGKIRDRIVILEDSNGDGTFDKRTIFWDQARKLTSLEVGNGGVWALCLPNLIFLPDRNRDDIPDGEPIVMLDGFNETTEGHTPANGLKWGPDGWLYGRHGILATSHVGRPGASESQRFAINTGVWRYHPIRQIAEPVMHGMTNSWGFDFDEHGEIFVINTVIGHLWHVVPGAHTERMFGLDLNPYSFQLTGQVADHVHWDTGEVWSEVRKGVTDRTSAAGGGHAHIGLMIYQGDNWPGEYRNRVYTLNLHGLRINSDFLKRAGAGYTATHGPDMCFLADPWFRGMDLITGPAGDVLLADWSDTGECHDHDGVHRTSGRLYRLSYGSPPALPQFDLNTQSNPELIEHLSDSNTWWARQSRRILTERAHSQLAPAELNALKTDLKNRLSKTADPIPRLRILETIATVDGADVRWWTQRLSSQNEYERVTALKFLVDLTTRDLAIPSTATLHVFEDLASHDPSGLMQLYLASTLQRLPIELRWNLAKQLVARAEFQNDRMLPLMIWYGIEPAIVANPQKALELLRNCRIPLVTGFISRRLMLEIERDPQTCDQLVELLLSGQCRFPNSVIGGMSQALNGWQKAIAPAKWSQVVEREGKTSDEVLRNQIQSLNVVFGDGRALEDIRRLVVDESATPESRQQALRSLMVNPPADYVPTLLKLLDDRAVTVEVLRALAHYDDPQIPRQILNRVRRFDAAARSEMIQTLSSRPAFARALLQAVRDQRIAANELSAFHARQIASFQDEELTRELVELWGEIHASAAEKQNLIAAQRKVLTPEVLANADLSAGRALFQKTCAGCHILYGTGRRLGPDLTGSNRKNLDYLLENIIDPSASVGADFRSVVVLLDDGRVLNGVVSEQNDRTLTLQSAQATVTLDRKAIEEIRPTKVSLMPEGQLQKLAPDQVRDLIAYLMGSAQVPLPAESSE